MELSQIKKPEHSPMASKCQSGKEDQPSDNTSVPFVLEPRRCPWKIITQDVFLIYSPYCSSTEQCAVRKKADTKCSSCANHLCVLVVNNAYYLENWMDDFEWNKNKMFPAHPNPTDWQATWLNRLHKAQGLQSHEPRIKFHVSKVNCTTHSYSVNSRKKHQTYY